MWKAEGALVAIAVFMQTLVGLVSAHGFESDAATTIWPTLSGDAPLVIARGGFSGLFPDSSYDAYNLALITSLPNVHLWCDVQLTKDEAGICFRDLRLDNGSSIQNLFQNGQKEYLVNGVPTKGWFALDYTLKQLSHVVVTQSIYSRTDKFDGNSYSILTVDDVAEQFKPPGLWLNVQHDIFYNQHNLSVRNYITSASRRVVISYISSPEVGFLRSIKGSINPKTQLVFRILTQDEIEPSTNQTYGSLLKNLTFIKTFASGILVPKFYIWPEVDLYLEPQTSLVLDAHREKLEVYASEFMNDYPLSYNYSYDPIAEYLNFVDTGGFSVDGLVSDFPLTPSEAIGCFAHLGKNDLEQAKPLVISKCGASGDYPSCTDLAYKKAIADGVDVLDCPVQMSKDGTPFCFSSINLIDSTTVAQSPFSNRTTIIPEIMAGAGIFTFSLTWNEIQTLTPSISTPFPDYSLLRNPKNKNSGHFLKLSEFLALTKNVTSLSGVLISIEHAVYLVEEEKLSATDAVIGALSKSGFGDQKVFIQSSNSSVLKKFKEKKNYNFVYRIEEKISDIDHSTLGDITKLASCVVVNKDSVFPESGKFLSGNTDLVKKLQSSNLSVFVETFSNEFVSQAWDFFSDSTVEINSFTFGANIDGVITDFPLTAARYKKNRCSSLGNPPSYMCPVQPGSLITLISAPYLPPAEAPNPTLTEQDVIEPPLTSVSLTPPVSSPGRSTASAPNGQPKAAACSFLFTMVTLVAAALHLF